VLFACFRDSSRAPLFRSLERRQTTRELSPRSFDEQELSNLVWAACGINRRPGRFALNGRTAGSASNSQDVNLHVLLIDDAYIYDAAPNLPKC
jgi:hypothetical protein